MVQSHFENTINLGVCYKKKTNLQKVLKICFEISIKRDRLYRNNYQTVFAPGHQRS